MKIVDIARQYKIDSRSFAAWVEASTYEWKYKFGGMVIDESQDIEKMVSEYKEKNTEQRAKKVAAKADRVLADQQKVQAMANMLITSGFNFDGYTISKYSGYISGDDAIQIPRGSGGWFNSVTDVGASLMSSLVQIRRNALAELKEAAYDLGCNAVIGVDFDYLTLDPETVSGSGGTLYLPYVFGVTANGNAVIIEKNERIGL